MINWSTTVGAQLYQLEQKKKRRFKELQEWEKKYYMGHSTCFYCNGTGRGLFFTCNKCNGIGIQPVFRCPTCLTTTYIPASRCALCKGRGNVDLVTLKYFFKVD